MAEGSLGYSPQDSTGGDPSSSAANGGSTLDNSNGEISTSSSNSLVAEGLCALLSSVMEGFDSRTEATARSQDQVFLALDRLTGVSGPTANIVAAVNSIPMFNGTDFMAWKESILITLGVIDLDLALRIPKPSPLTVKSTSNEKREMEKWEKSNRISLMIFKRAIPEVFQGIASDEVEIAKDFLEDIEKRFAGNEKAETSVLLAKIISMRYNGRGGIREYIIEMSNLASKLRALKMDISECFLVHLVLFSLPAQFRRFRTSYHHQRDSWSLTELMSHCVLEEERLKQERAPGAHFATPVGKKDNKRKKDKEAENVILQKKQKTEERTKDACFFCGIVGHKKKQSVNYHAWRAKKELDKLLEDAPSPFIMQHASRISAVRKRVKALNSVLKSIQRRIDNMDRMLSAASMQEGMASERGVQH